MRAPKDSDPKDSDVQKALLTAADCVVGAAVLIALGAWAGGFLDQQWHTTPLLALVLALLGGTCGLVRMVIKANKVNEPPKR